MKQLTLYITYVIIKFVMVNKAALKEAATSQTLSACYLHLLLIKKTVLTFDVKLHLISL